MDYIFEVAKIISGGAYVLFLPGFLLSFAFLRRGSIDYI